MIRIVYLLRELARNLYRNIGTTLSSFLSLTLLLLLFDIFWVGANTSERLYGNLLSGLTMEAFISEDAPDSTVARLRSSISMMDGVAAVEYVSKEAAREELTRLVGSDLLVGYDTLNPLPRSLMLSFKGGYLSSPQLESIESELAGMAGITEVSFSRRWLDKAEKTRAIILNVGLVLGGLVLLTALVGSANNIRLTTRTRAVGFQQMRLLGAGRLFLAFPFLLEGLLLGGLAALAGWLLIFYGKHKVSFTQFEVVFPTGQEIAIFCIAAGVLGAVAGYFGLRKLLA